MGLFAPWFLAGVAAIGLPIYLHLLRRHSTTPRPFSSLMFFEPRTQSSIKHRRLRKPLSSACCKPLACPSRASMTCPASP